VNAIMGQMTEMSQRRKNSFSVGL